MRLLFLFAILLAFPVLELWILIELGGEYGWWLMAYLLLMIVLGWRLIQDEKQLAFGRMAETLVMGGTPGMALFGSAKNFLAGALLLIPGVISDVLAVILLLIPGGKGPRGRRPRQGKSRAANDDVIEGEYRRED